MTKRQINYILGLLTTLVIGIFIYPLYFNRYAIYAEHNIVVPILLDKVTGETWRYFRNIKDGETVEEGWYPLWYVGYQSGRKIEARTPAGLNISRTQPLNSKGQEKKTSFIPDEPQKGKVVFDEERGGGRFTVERPKAKYTVEEL